MPTSDIWEAYHEMRMAKLLRQFDIRLREQGLKTTRCVPCDPKCHCMLKPFQEVPRELKEKMRA